MKTYNLKLNAAQPIRQCLGVPTNTSKYGIVVTPENIGTSNLSCSMVDGESTIYASNRGDGTFLFTLSSDGVERDRQVKVVLEAGATNIGGLVTEYQSGAFYISADIISLPAGKYVAGELVEKLADLGKQTTTLTHYIKPYSEHQANLVGFT